MNRWFDWAGEPSDRRSIDNERRAQLATMESIAYNIAGDAQASVNTCDTAAEAASRAATAKADEERDTGECKARSIHLPKLVEDVPGVTMDADCHKMTMSIDWAVLDKIGSPKLEIERATATSNGKFFIGVERSNEAGTASGTGGLQVTWNNGGWVQSAGGVLSGTAGIDGVAQVSGDLFINGQQTGPALSGSVGANTPAFGFAPSVNFGGR
jgi:hypothetical protein